MRARAPIRWGTFLKLSLVVAVSILVTNLCTMLSSTYIAQNLFIQSSTFLNAKLMDQILNRVEESHTAYQTLIWQLETDPALKNYFMADGPDGVEAFTMTYDVQKACRSHSPADAMPPLVTIGSGGEVFSLDGDSLRVPPGQVEELFGPNRIGNGSRRLTYRYQDAGITDGMAGQKCVIAARRMFLPASSQSFATAYITIPEPVFYGMFRDAVPDGSRMLILSQDGRVVSGNDKDILGTSLPGLLSLAQSMGEEGAMYRNVGYGRGAKIVIPQYIPDLDMYMVNVIDQATLLKSYAGVRRRILLAGFLAAGAAIAVVFAIMRRIASPLAFFMRQLDSFRNGRFEKVRPGKESPEVRQMAEVYNRMVDEIERHVGRLMEEQERSRRLEIEALQMQINPHFMYNTLASVKYLAWQGDTGKASDTVNALIAILRKTIGDLNGEISLREEVDLVRQYALINQVRYGDDIRVEYFLSEACMDCMVPKLILQPFIENAFFHAFQNKKEGAIRIFTKRQKDDLVCEVIDEGDGMTQEEVDSLLTQDRHRHLTGIGIPNVHERLRLMYGEGYGVAIHSVAGSGTSVSIRMPWHLKKIPKP